MRLFGRGNRPPQALEWGSSFAEAGLEAGSRRKARSGSAYDGSTMSFDHPADHRPIGSRRHDVLRPEGMGSVPPPPRGGRGIGRRIASLLLLLAAIALIGGLVWVALSFTGVGEHADVKAGTPVKVVIPQGANSAQIATILAESGVVGRASIFRARLRLNGDGSEFRSGTYRLKAGSSYDTIVRVLEKGPAAAPTFDLTIPEGQRLEETAAYIDELRSKAQREGGQVLPAFTGAEYLKAVNAAPLPTNLQIPRGTTKREGLLFPATFQLKLTATAEDFVAKQQQSFADNIAEVDMTRAKAANLTPYDIVIIASLIEREAQLDKERPLVAAVIWNRLKVGEPLGIDASNQYGVYTPGADEFWESALKQSQLETEGPYNLRLKQGLPPTPIAEPSRASLDAAANPAKVDYRYYVTKGDGSGGHFFTADYDEFLAHQ